MHNCVKCYILKAVNFVYIHKLLTYVCYDYHTISKAESAEANALATSNSHLPWLNALRRHDKITMITCVFIVRQLFTASSYQIDNTH